MKINKILFKTFLVACFVTLSCQIVMADEKEDLTDLFVKKLNRMHGSDSELSKNQFYTDGEYICFETTLVQAAYNTLSNDAKETMRQSSILNMARIAMEQSPEDRKTVINLYKKMGMDFKVIIRDEQGSNISFIIKTDEIIKEIEACKDPLTMAQKSLKLNAESMKYSLPQQVDEYTVFEDVYFKDNKFCYSYRLIGLDEYIKDATILDNLKSTLQGTLLTHFTSALADPNVKTFAQLCIAANSPIVYRYKIATETLDITLSVEQLIKLLQ